MIWLRVVEASLGVVVLVLVMHDAFRVVVMPRPLYGRSISKMGMRWAWRGWRRLGLRRGTVERREATLGVFAQIALLLLLAFWVVGLVLGYALVLHALHHQLEPESQSFWSVFYFAGDALLTVGIGDIVPKGTGARIVMLATAASGPAVIGLVLSLLFSLYASFQRREALITTLDASAGAPPSGVRLLQTYVSLGMEDQLPSLFRAWELWTAEVLDSHLAYPLLAFFRSTHDNESWISALGAVLDAATLSIATGAASAGSAQLMYDMGCHAVEDLSNYFALHHDHDAGVDRAEFDDALRTLADEGYVVAHPTAAWEEFERLRTQYAGPLNALAQDLVTPPALWIGDRSTLHTDAHP
jgi:hypothetical protein